MQSAKALRKASVNKNSIKGIRVSGIKQVKVVNMILFHNFLSESFTYSFHHGQFSFLVIGKDVK